MQIRTIRIKDISVEQMDVPWHSKIRRYKHYFNEYGVDELLRINPIVIRDNKLIDGYCSYQVLLENQAEYVDVLLLNNPIKVVEAIHLNEGRKPGRKVYRWQYGKGQPVLPGDVLLVRNSKILKPVEVKNIIVMEREEAEKYKKIARRRTN